MAVVNFKSGIEAEKQVLERFLSVVAIEDTEETKHVYCVQNKGIGDAGSIAWPALSERGLYNHLKRVRGEYSAYISTQISCVDENGEVRNRKKNFNSMFMVVLDDIGTKAEKPPLKPTYVIESSEGNYQYGYVFVEPVRDFALAQGIVDVIYKSVYSDGGGALTGKYVRLPVGVNNKVLEGGEGVNRFPVRLVTLNEVYYTPEQVIEGLGLKMPDVSGGIGKVAAPKEDPILAWLREHDVNFKDDGDEFCTVTCPNSEGHSDDAVVAGFSPAGRGGGGRGFNCFHEHCAELDIKWYLKQLKKQGCNTGSVVDADVDGDGEGVDDPAELINKYCFVVGKNKFFDFESGTLINREAFNQAEFGGFTEEGKALQASGRFKKDGGVCVHDTAWEPVGDDAGPFLEIDGGVYVNTFKMPKLDIPSLVTENEIQGYLDLVEWVIPDARERSAVLDHIAFTMQRPEVKINWGIIISGVEGSGKDMMFKPVSRYFGSNFSDVDPNDGGKMAWGDTLAKKKVLVLQEVYQPGNRNFGNTLKNWVADTGSGYSTLNMKGRGMILQKNLYSVYGLSNFDEPMHLTEGDRRWFVINSVDKGKRDIAFYSSVAGFLKRGGNEKVIRWFLDRDISGFNRNEIPFKNAARSELINSSKTDTASMCERMLHAEEGIFNPSIPVFSLEQLARVLQIKTKHRVSMKGLAIDVKEIGVDIRLLARNRKMVSGRTESHSVRVWINPNYEDKESLLNSTDKELFDLYLETENSLKELLLEVL